MTCQWNSSEGRGLDRLRSQHCTPYIASGRGWLAGDWPSTGGAFSTLLRRPGLRASNGGFLAT